MLKERSDCAGTGLENSVLHWPTKPVHKQKGSCHTKQSEMYTSTDWMEVRQSTIKDSGLGVFCT